MRAAVDNPGPNPAWYDAPTSYFTNPYAVIEPCDDAPVPPGSKQLEFELEVAVVVGASGHDLAPADAYEAVFGYCILNDWSASDIQRREMKGGPGAGEQGKDSLTTLSP